MLVVANQLRCITYLLLPIRHQESDPRANRRL